MCVTTGDRVHFREILRPAVVASIPPLVWLFALSISFLRHPASG